MKIVNIILVSMLLSGCLSNRVIFVDIQAKQDESILIGSRRMKGGAQIDTFVSAIDNEAIEIKRNGIGAIYNPQYKKPVPTTPGMHSVKVEAWQCDVARHVFDITLEPGKVYVTHAVPISQYEAQIWISYAGSEDPITEKVTAKKVEKCGIIIVI